MESALARQAEGSWVRSTRPRRRRGDRNGPDPARRSRPATRLPRQVTDHGPAATPAVGSRRSDRQLLGNAGRDRAGIARPVGGTFGIATVGGHLPDETTAQCRRHRAGSVAALAQNARVRRGRASSSSRDRAAASPPRWRSTSSSMTLPKTASTSSSTRRRERSSSGAMIASRSAGREAARHRRRQVGRGVPQHPLGRQCVGRRGRHRSHEASPRVRENAAVVKTGA